MAMQQGVHVGMGVPEPVDEFVFADRDHGVTGDTDLPRDGQETLVNEHPRVMAIPHERTKPGRVATEMGRPPEERRVVGQGVFVEQNAQIGSGLYHASAAPWRHMVYNTK